MKNFQEQCRDVLIEEGINAESKIDFDVNGELHSLSLSYIIDTYMQASPESQLVFLTAMKKSLETKESMGIDKFFEGMGQLLLMTHLSEKFEA